jgi:hypothetical protein
MRLLLLLAMALPAASAAAPPPQRDRAAVATASTDCRDHSRLRMADRPARAARVTRLGEEPTAALALTVYRVVGGCPEPAIIRTGIGSGR